MYAGVKFSFLDYSKKSESKYGPNINMASKVEVIELVRWGPRLNGH
jgi:hypothetical protein